MHEVPPDLIEKFNEAARLAEAGKAGRALELLDAIIAPPQNASDATMIPLEFLARAHMRKAWCLMDLKLFQEAQTMFESSFIHATLNQLDQQNQFDYHFSYANCLGEVGDLQAMDANFARALDIAANSGDAYKSELCWLNLLHYAELHKSWTYLESESKACIRFAENSNLPKLALAAALRRAKALFSLERRDHAASQLTRAKKLAESLGESAATEAAEKIRQLHL